MVGDRLGYATYVLQAGAFLAGPFLFLTCPFHKQMHFCVFVLYKMPFAEFSFYQKTIMIKKTRPRILQRVLNFHMRFDIRGWCNAIWGKRVQNSHRSLLPETILHKKC